MFKDILVEIPVGAPAGPAVNYAVSLAKSCAAHLAGVAFAYDPVIPGTIFDGVAASVVESYRAESIKAFVMDFLRPHGDRPVAPLLAGALLAAYASGSADMVGAPVSKRRRAFSQAIWSTSPTAYSASGYSSRKASSPFRCSSLQRPRISSTSGS